MTAEKKPNVFGTAPGVPRLGATAQPGSGWESRANAARADGASNDGRGDIDPAREAMLAAQKGDVEAFRTLLEMYQDRVMRTMTSVLRCDRTIAEDLCQEVFLRVHKGLPKFDGQVRFLTWLHTIAMNVAISEYRRQRTQKRGRRTLSIDAPIQGTDDLYIVPTGRETEPGERAHHHEFLAKVRGCVRELPDEFRECVILRDMESLSYEEIAAVLDLPIGTVRSRIHRGRLLLQGMLKGFDR